MSEIWKEIPGYSRYEVSSPILNIRALHRDGVLCKDLAQAYDINSEHIMRVTARQSWKGGLR